MAYNCITALFLSTYICLLNSANRPLKLSHLGVHCTPHDNKHISPLKGTFWVDNIPFPPAGICDRSRLSFRTASPSLSRKKLANENDFGHAKIKQRNRWSLSQQNIKPVSAPPEKQQGSGVFIFLSDKKRYPYWRFQIVFFSGMSWFCHFVLVLPFWSNPANTPGKITAGTWKSTVWKEKSSKPNLHLKCYPPWN